MLIDKKEKISLHEMQFEGSNFRYFSPERTSLISKMRMHYFSVAKHITACSNFKLVTDINHQKRKS